MKVLKSILFASMAIVALASCSKSDDPTPATPISVSNTYWESTSASTSQIFNGKQINSEMKTIAELKSEAFYNYYWLNADGYVYKSIMGKPTSTASKSVKWTLSGDKISIKGKILTDNDTTVICPIVNNTFAFTIVYGTWTATTIFTKR